MLFSNSRRLHLILNKVNIAKRKKPNTRACDTYCVEFSHRKYNFLHLFHIRVFKLFNIKEEFDIKCPINAFLILVTPNACNGF